jgi:hypothetical protein
VTPVPAGQADNRVREWDREDRRDTRDREWDREDRRGNRDWEPREERTSRDRKRARWEDEEEEAEQSIVKRWDDEEEEEERRQGKVFTKMDNDEAALEAEIRQAKENLAKEREQRELRIMGTNPFGGAIPATSPTLSSFLVNSNPKPTPQTFLWSNTAAKAALAGAGRKPEEGGKEKGPEEEDVEKIAEELQRKAMQQWEEQAKAQQRGALKNQKGSDEGSKEDKIKRAKQWAEKLEKLLARELASRQEMAQGLEDTAEEIAELEAWYRQSVQDQEAASLLKKAKWEKRRKEEEARRCREDAGYRKAKEEEEYVQWQRLEEEERAGRADGPEEHPETEASQGEMEVEQGKPEEEEGQREEGPPQKPRPEDPFMANEKDWKGKEPRHILSYAVNQEEGGGGLPTPKQAEPPIRVRGSRPSQVRIRTTLSPSPDRINAIFEPAIIIE